MTGAERIAFERDAQIAQWGDKHDDWEHRRGDLATAAATIAGDHLPRFRCFNKPGAKFWGSRLAARWRENRLRQLVVAGALIAAEIDRMERGGRAPVVGPRAEERGVKENRPGWEELDADRFDFFAVLVGEDYSIQPDALFRTKEEADEWVTWQQSLWTEPFEKGISPNAEVFVLPVRELRGMCWNSFDPLPEDGPC